MTKRTMGFLTTGIFMVAALGGPASTLAAWGGHWPPGGGSNTTHASAMALSATDAPTTTPMVDECITMMQQDPSMSAMMKGASADMMDGGMTWSGMMGRQAMVADR